VARCIAFLLLGLLMVVGAPALAASPWQNLADPVFIRTDSRELPEAAVMALAQDRAGFLWVGTQGGLARYDGYHFRSFLPNASDPKALPDGYVRMLLPAADGLWIGSSSNGLVRFDAATETFRTWRPGPNGGKGPRSASVDALADVGGTLWVGGDGGLDRFEPRTGVFAPVGLAARGAQPVVWILLADRSGTLWAGTQAGLYYRRAGAAQFRPFSLGARSAAPPVYSLYEDHLGRLWAGSVNAAYVLDPARHGARALTSSQTEAASLAPGQQWSVTEVTPGVIWIGTDDAISIVDAAYHVHRVATDPKNPGGLANGRVLQLLRERSGLVLIADHIGGLLMYNPSPTGLYQLSGTKPAIGLGDEGAPAVVVQPGPQLWIGGFDGRLAEFTPSGLHSRVVHVPNNAAVQELLTGSDGRLWIGTTGGLCRLRPGETDPGCPQRPSQLVGASIYALLEDRGKLWIGGSTGLWVEDLATRDLTAVPGPNQPALSNNQVRVLFLDRRHRLWVGTENGLDRIDPGGRLVRFAFTPGDPNSIGPGGMTTIMEDRRGRIWAGAAGGPLNVLQDNGSGGMRVRHIGVADGMPHENVNAIAEDIHGRIWASTDRGLAEIDPDTLRARGFGYADGVSAGAFWAGTVSRSADGTLFFGGLEGLTIVAPDAGSVWNYAPPLVVTALQLGHRTVPAWSVNRGDGNVDVPAGARDINVEFSSLDYSSPQTLRYEYKLDGYDREWIDTDAQHRVATYTQLSPGDYTLEVRATNRLGVWSRDLFRLGVHALPAWWETWWFRLLVAVLVVLVAYVTHLVRTTVLRRRQRELEAIVDKRTSELSEANVKLQELSLSDPLTGLRNRRFLTQHLEGDIAMTLRRYEDWNSSAAVDLSESADVLFFLVDLDHFKVVNDRYGHHAGDLLLMQMRERLQEVFRESDFVVRWGGDEFLTVTREGRRGEAGPIAERIREAVASRPFSLGNGQTLAASVSVGFAAFPFLPSAPAAVTWLQVVGLADHALYMAKQGGRNTWFGLASTAKTQAAIRANPQISVDQLVAMGAVDVLSRLSEKETRPR
jgi:diguanylate cyclase (GGDEF)-like protein